MSYIDKFTTYFKTASNVSIAEPSTTMINRNNVIDFGITTPQLNNTTAQSKNNNVSASNYNIKLGVPYKHPEIKNFFNSLSEHIAAIHKGPNVSMKSRITNKALNESGQDIYYIPDKPVLPKIMTSLARTQTVRHNLNSTTEYTTPVHTQVI